MGYRAVLFDLDGTLADTLATISAALNHGLLVLGLPTHGPEAVRGMVGEGVTVLCAKALPGGAEHLHARLLAEVRAFYDRNVLLHARLYDGMAELVRALRSRGLRLAVLSNKPHHLTVGTVEGLGVGDLFDVILGHREPFPRKPDPTSARWILERLEAAPEEALYVGDTAIDVETARRAGCPVAAVSWGFRPRAVLEPLRPDHLVDSPAEILRLV